MKGKNILIVEKSTFQLMSKGVETNPDGHKYTILEGIFGVLNEMNRNKRIYTAEQYLPQVDRLQEKIKANKLLGELNHPTDRFDIDLNSVSHVIEKLYFDEATNQIKGRIRILTTPAGQIAEQLVNDGIPLHISSRAAGSVGQDGTVIMKHLFTYDLVAEPGFEKAELTRVNEKYGYGDLENISLYEISEADLDEQIAGQAINQKIEKKDNIYNKKEEMDYITKDQFNQYTEYVRERMTVLNEKCSSKKETTSTDEKNEEVEELQEKYEEITEKFNELVGFVNYLSEHLNRSINHGDHVVENVMGIKTYINYLTKSIDKNVDYQRYLTENVDKLISHNNSIVTTVNKDIEFTNYLREGLNSLISEVHQNRQYTQYVAEGADKGIQYTESLGELLDQGLQFTNHIGEKVNETANFTNYLRGILNKSINYGNHLAEGVKSLVPGSQSLNESNTNYEMSITTQLDTIINEAKRQKAGVTDNTLHFLQFLSNEKVREFNALNETTKVKVVTAFDKNAYYGTADAIAIYENALIEKQPAFISDMKVHHKELWGRLSEAKKTQIFEQAKNYVLKTQDQIDEFWNTVDTREEKVNFQSINENDQNNEKDKLHEQKALGLPSDTYMNDFEASMMERMN